MGRSWKKKKKTLLYKISSDRMGFHSRSHTAMALQWLREPRGEASQFLPSQLPALNSGGSNTKNALLTLLASMFVARAVCKKSWESRKKWLCSAQGWLCNVAEAIRRQIYWVKAVTVKEDKFWLSSRNALLAQEGLFPRGRPMLQLVPVPLGTASGPSISGTLLGWGRYLQGIPQCLLACSWASPHPEASPCTPWPPPLWGLPGLTPVWQSLWAPNQPQYLGVISQVPSRGERSLPSTCCLPQVTLKKRTMSPGHLQVASSGDQNTCLEQSSPSCSVSGSDPGGFCGCTQLFILHLTWFLEFPIQNVLWILSYCDAGNQGQHNFLSQTWFSQFSQ